MKRFCVLLLLVLSLSACGPSEEKVAAQIASTLTAVAGSWTPTPANTPTPTPIPYNASIQIMDENENPLEGAEVTIPDLVTQVADTNGITNWSNLAGADLEVQCSLQGYKPVDVEETIERGENEIIVQMERDPFGLLPSEILEEGQSLLMIEDFQNNTDLFDDMVGNWKIIEDPSDPGNMVMEVSPMSSNPESASVTFGDPNLVDFIIQYRIKYTDLDYDSDNWTWFSFRSKYAVSFSPYYDVIDIIDYLLPDWTWLNQKHMKIQNDTWYTIKVIAIEDEAFFYLNGNQMARVRDMRIPAYIEPFSFITGVDVHAYYDDIIIISPAEESEG